MQVNSSVQYYTEDDLFLHSVNPVSIIIQISQFVVKSWAESLIFINSYATKSRLYKKYSLANNVYPFLIENKVWKLKLWIHETPHLSHYLLDFCFITCHILQSDDWYILSLFLTGSFRKFLKFKHLTPPSTSLGISKMWSTIFHLQNWRRCNEICPYYSKLRINKTIQMFKISVNF